MRDTVNKSDVRLHGRVVFVGAVTAILLAFVFEQAARGFAGLPGVFVYSLAAGFGLEFVSSIWAGRWRGRARQRQLQG